MTSKSPPDPELTERLRSGGAGDVLVFLLAGNPSCVFPLFSRTLVQSEIPQLSN